MTSPPDIAKAAPDASVFLSHDGVLFYTMLFIIGWLLIRDALKDRLIWRIVNANKEADKIQADALHSFHVTLSRVESAVGVQQVKRLVEKGELTTGVIP